MSKRYMMVGVIRDRVEQGDDGRIKKSGIVGYKVIDIKTLKLLDIKVKEISSVIGDISNIGIDGGRVVGKQGSINRYAEYYKENSLVGNHRVVIVGVRRVGDVKEYLVVVGWLSGYVTFNELVKLIKVNGCANGKLVVRGGKEIVSAIVGKFNDLGVVEKKSSGGRGRVGKERDTKEQLRTRYRYINKGGEYSNSLKAYMGYILSEEYISVLLSSGSIGVDLKIRDIDKLLYNKGITYNKLRKLLVRVVSGRYGRRTKEHYSNVVKYINSGVDVRKILGINDRRTKEHYSNVVKYINSGVDVRKILGINDRFKEVKEKHWYGTSILGYGISKEEYIEYIMFIVELYKDYIIYAKRSVINEGKELVRVVKRSKEWRDGELEGVLRELIFDDEITKGQIKFISALELIKMRGDKKVSKDSIRKVKRLVKEVDKKDRDAGGGGEKILNVVIKELSKEIGLEE